MAPAWASGRLFRSLFDQAIHVDPPARIAFVNCDRTLLIGRWALALGSDAFDDIFALIHHAVTRGIGLGCCSLQHTPAESAPGAGREVPARPATGMRQVAIHRSCVMWLT